MPRVKIDFVASYSSEYSEHPASNLLEKEISKKRWVCSKGETSCSVVLQLARSVQVSAVHIGVYHSALVEVLVGRSENVNDPFKVLVPSCTFINPMDSRKSEGLERVRSFSVEQMSADVRGMKWDRVRVVCSQPYNKHCQFGLSFIHIFEPETKDTPMETPKPTPVPSRLLGLDVASSDDEDNFKPGELFAKHLLNKSDVVSNGEKKAGLSTDTQIRRASSQAIKNISDSATKLVKTPLSKDKNCNRGKNPHSIQLSSDRQRTSLMYNKDDDGPHEKIDKIVQRHQDEKTRKEDEIKKNKPETKKQDPQKDKQRDESDDSKSKDGNSKVNDHKNGYRTPKMEKADGVGSDTKKRKRSPSKEKKLDNVKRLRAGPVSSSPHSLLSGVIFTLSGYVNPRRASVRDQALAMGAKCERDWTPRCTHLICAFANTPKLKTVRSLPNGSSFAVATADWIEDCCKRRRLLPWQWYATEPQLKQLRPSEEELDREEAEAGSGLPEERKPDSDCDTDDEIEKVLQKQRDSQKKSPSPIRAKESPKRTNGSTNSKNTRRENENDPTHNQSHSSDVEFIRDERFQGQVTVSDSEDSPATLEMEIEEQMADEASLPNFLEGLTFVVDPGVEEAGFDGEQLRRYICAYGGEVIQDSHLDEGSEVSYVLCASARQNMAGRAVRADWLWRCHEKGRLCSVDDYLL